MGQYTKNCLRLHNKWLVLLLSSAALFLVGIDMTVLYTALPSLTHDLNASNSQKLWIINAYPLVMAGLLPGFGTLGDRIGHRSIFIWGLAVFGFASLVMAFSPSANILIAGRAFLAVGAAMMSPATLALLRQAFITDKERTLAIGIWGSVSAGAAAFGPLIGGALLSQFWWGSVFLINVPIILVALLFAPILLKKRLGNSDRVWDFLSSLFLMAGIVGLVYALKEFIKADSDIVQALIALTIGFIFTVLFVKHQRTTSSPMIDFGLFRNSQFIGGILVILVSMLGLMGVQFALTQRLQLVQGYSPFEAGVFIVPVFIASFVAGPTVGAVLHRIGIVRSLWMSMFVAAIGIIVFLCIDSEHIIIQMIALSLIGFGIGSGMATGSSAIMLNAPEDKAGMAASIETVSYELGGAIGVAIIGSIMTFVYTKTIILPNGLTKANIAKDSIDQAFLLSEKLDTHTAYKLISSAKLAFNQSFHFAILIVAGIMILLGLVFLFFYKSNTNDKQENKSLTF